MRIAIGCDHRGLSLKRAIMDYLSERGDACEDFGCHSADSVDYPDYARAVAQAVSQGHFDHGILICATGVGMSVAANKVPGVYAALCHDVFSARRSRQHNNANVLCLGALVLGEGLATEIVEAHLNAAFEGGRHARRLDKVKALERA